jgi:phage terminase Nu1 subunit (DNA packaging protein)
MKKDPIADAVVNAATIGRVLGISRASIANLATDGVLPRASRGEFNLAACVQAYIQHKHVTAGGDKVANLTVERSRLAKAKADKAERDERVEKGELVPADDVEAAWLATAGMVRMRLLAIPKKLAPRMIMLKTAAEAETLVQKELNSALSELAAKGSEQQHNKGRRRTQ